MNTDGEQQAEESLDQQELRNLKAQINRLRIFLTDDHQWLASDQTARELTRRYLDMTAPNWRARKIEKIDTLRNRLGLNPNKHG